jgi:hypothetical protein
LLVEAAHHLIGRRGIALANPLPQVAGLLVRKVLVGRFAVVGFGYLGV